MGTRSNEYLQSIFFNRNKNNNVYSCKPQFYYIKVGFKGVIIILTCLRDDVSQKLYLGKPVKRTPSTFVKLNLKQTINHEIENKM